MTYQQTISPNPKPFVGAVLAVLVLTILLGALNGPLAQQNNLSGIACRAALDLLPSMLPAAWQAVQSFMLHNHRFCPCAVETLVSFLPLLRFLAGAA